MSIPKEPRQLMINLMYLVLTALLALNVSAEVMNAFFSLDKGIKNSNSIIETANGQIMSAIDAQVEAYQGRDDFKLYQAKAKRASTLTKEFNGYVQSLWDGLFEAAGGDDPKDPGKPKRKKDKDVTTRMFVLGDAATPADDGVGFELEKRILTLRDSLKSLVNAVVDPSKPDEVEAAKSVIESLSLEEPTIPENSEKKNWSDFTFRQMPVAAVFPILTKMKNDAETSESALMNYFFGKMGSQEIIFDKFEPVASATTGYVIKGDTYEADIFLSAYSSQSAGTSSVYVNGSRVKMDDGKGKYTAGTGGSGLGPKKYNVRIDVTNPLTGEVKKYTKEFTYEVGERSIAVSADKMNVFYLGVKNPISVSAAGIPTNELRVGVSGGGGATIKKINNVAYEIEAARATRPDEFCYVTVSGGGVNDKKPFRVKRIPDPIARLSGQNGGTMGTGEFKAQGGVGAPLDNFDFAATCRVQGFELVYVPKRGDARSVINKGPRYTSEAVSLVNKAKPGDTYYFFAVKARCPGDTAGRKINDMVFKIK